jgi:hypothetical protein
MGNLAGGIKLHAIDSFDFSEAGKERTRAEFRLLLEDAGFKFEGISATPTPVSVIRALA